MSPFELDQYLDDLVAAGPDRQNPEARALPGPAGQLASTLALIARWPAAQPPADLSARVLARLGLAAAPIPFPADADRARALPWVMRSEAWAIAACLVAMFGILVPALHRSRDLANRRDCEFNLTAVGEALAAYSAGNSGVPLPHQPAPQNVAWTWQAPPGTPVAPNTRHPFLLLKTGLLQPEHMVCEATDHAPLETSPAALDNFEKPEQMSYSFQNLSAGQPSVVVAAEFAVMADRNPIFERPAADGTYDATAAASSSNHDREGENVLYMDGHVAWRRGTTAGVRGDNIWTVADIGRTRYTGTERPTNPNDSFLVP